MPLRRAGLPPSRQPKPPSHLAPKTASIGGPARNILGTLSQIIHSPKYNLRKSVLVQGIVYFGCLISYLGILGSVLLYGLQNMTTDQTLKRRAIYAALGKKRTLLGLAGGARLAVRFSAKFYYTSVLPWRSRQDRRHMAVAPGVAHGAAASR